MGIMFDVPAGETAVLTGRYIRGSERQKGVAAIPLFDLEVVNATTEQVWIGCADSTVSFFLDEIIKLHFLVAGSTNRRRYER